MQTRPSVASLFAPRRLITGIAASSKEASGSQPRLRTIGSPLETHSEQHQNGTQEPSSLMMGCCSAAGHTDCMLQGIDLKTSWNSGGKGRVFFCSPSQQLPALPQSTHRQSIIQVQSHDLKSISGPSGCFPWCTQCAHESFIV